MSWRPARDTPSVMIIMICISSPAAPDTKTRHEWARADKEAQGGKRERPWVTRPRPVVANQTLRHSDRSENHHYCENVLMCRNQTTLLWLISTTFLLLAMLGWAGRGQCMFFSCGCCCAAGCCCWTSDLDQAALPIMLGQGGRVASQAAQPVLAVTNWLSQS